MPDWRNDPRRAGLLAEMDRNLYEQNGGDPLDEFAPDEVALREPATVEERRISGRRKAQQWVANDRRQTDRRLQQIMEEAFDPNAPPDLPDTGVPEWVNKAIEAEDEAYLNSLGKSRPLGADPEMADFVRGGEPQTYWERYAANQGGMRSEAAFESTARDSARAAARAGLESSSGTGRSLNLLGDAKPTLTSRVIGARNRYVNLRDRGLAAAGRAVEAVPGGKYVMRGVRHPATRFAGRALGVAGDVMGGLDMAALANTAYGSSEALDDLARTRQHTADLYGDIDKARVTRQLGLHRLPGRVEEEPNAVRRGLDAYTNWMYGDEARKER